jgi:hypothetical protein
MYWGRGNTNRNFKPELWNNDTVNQTPKRDEVTEERKLHNEMLFTKYF